MSFQQPPPEWSKDYLTQFLTDTHNNSYYVFHHHKEVFGLFSEGCELFEMVESCIRKPSGWAEFVSVLFFNLARSSYYSSIKILVGGQLTETYALLRQCLENSLMAFYFFNEFQEDENTGANQFELWLRRGEGEEIRKKVRNTFTTGLIKNKLKEKEPGLGTTINALYEKTIDSGAHPNELALMSGLSFSDYAENMLIQQRFVIDFEEQWIHFLNCSKILLEIGIGSLSIFESIFKQKFQDAGISNRVESIKRKYGDVIRKHQV